MISPPFELLGLPNVAAEKLSHKPIFVDGSNFHVGISQSSISTVSLRPSRVLNVFSVPPSVEITAVATDGSRESPRLIYASNERKKHYLKIVDSDLSQHLKTPVAGLHYSNGLFIAVYPDSSLEAFSATNLESKWKRSAKSGCKYLYSAMIDETACVLVSGTSKHKVTIETLALDSAGIRQLAETHLEFSASARKYSYFDGTVYRCEGKTLQLYTLPEANLSAEFDLQGTEDIQDMIALPNNNVAIVHGTSLSIVDCSYRSTISKCDLPPNTPINLLAYSPITETIIASSPKHILGFSVSPSTGTLLESIGHGVAAANPQFLYGHCDLLPSLLSKGRFVPVLLESIKDTQEESTKVLEDLKLAASKQDSETFGKLVSYLKGSAWGQAVSSKETQVYEDSDRQLDREFMKHLVYLVFNIQAGQTELTYLSFLSNDLAIYLLTHPLFPTGEPETAALFSELKKYPQLYRQAIVTLSSATAVDILGGLFSRDEEIFHDAITRLNEEFGQQQITQAVKTLFKTKANPDDLIQVIERLSETQHGWPLISPLMDTLGLLAWDKYSLDVLSTRVDEQLETINSAVTTNRLISELLMSVDIDTEDGKVLSNGEIKRRSKKSQEVTNAKNEPEDVPRYSVETLVFN